MKNKKMKNAKLKKKNEKNWASKPKKILNEVLEKLENLGKNKERESEKKYQDQKRDREKKYQD